MQFYMKQLCTIAEHFKEVLREIKIKIISNNTLMKFSLTCFDNGVAAAIQASYKRIKVMRCQR